MNNLHSNFGVALVAFGLFFASLLPAWQHAKQENSDVHSRIGSVYVAPNPNDPHAPSGNVSVDDLLKYSDQKAAERKAMVRR
jgi:hypothetical protein